MAKQGIPESAPVDKKGDQLPVEWRMYFQETQRRISALEAANTALAARVTALETP